MIARTDALQQHGYDEVLARLRGARDVGAGMGILEGPRSEEEARRIVRDLAPWPMLFKYYGGAWCHADDLGRVGERDVV